VATPFCVVVARNVFRPATPPSGKTGGHGEGYREGGTGLESADAGELPSTQHRVGDGMDAAAPLFAAAERQFPQVIEYEPVPQNAATVAIIQAGEIRVLRSAGILHIIEAARPRVFRLEQEPLRESFSGLQLQLFEVL
jgi:hypothetical protein